MEQTIEQFTAAYSDWTHKNNTLVGNWKVSDFSTLRVIVGQICDLAAEHDHHPDVTFGYNTLHVETTTHDVGNTVTHKDIDLAKAISGVVGE